MARQNSRVFILIFLGMLTAFGPFVTDMYLPTFPEMADFFHTSSSMVQLGLTASMIGLAAGQLFFGPLSDKYGRRPLLIAGMFLFLVSTLGCIYSQTAGFYAGMHIFADRPAVCRLAAGAGDSRGKRDCDTWAASGQGIRLINCACVLPSQSRVQRPMICTISVNEERMPIVMQHSHQAQSKPSLAVPKAIKISKASREFIRCR